MYEQMDGGASLDWEASIIIALHVQWFSYTYFKRFGWNFDISPPSSVYFL